MSKRFTEAYLHKAAAADGNGTPLNVIGYGPMVIQVTGTFSGVVTFQASLDGTNYQNIVVYDTPTNTAAVSTTDAANLFYCNVHGLSYVRAVISSYASGAITVLARAVEA